MAGALGGRRLGLLGMEDVSAGGLSIECKERERPIKTLDTWMEQAVGNAGDKIPAVVLHINGRRHESDYLILRFGDVATNCKSREEKK